jgi:hypothetical protein
MSDIKKILDRPFNPKLIKKRRGMGGAQLRYVEGSQYIRRLNEAFNCDWDFEVVDRFELEDSIVVKVRLTVPSLNQDSPFTTTTKEAFGGTEIKRLKSNKKHVALADDYKSAETDGLKKACSMLGIGLHLYSEPEPEPIPPHDPVTETQLKEMKSIAVKVWGDSAKDGLLQLCRQHYDRPYNKITRKEGSEVLELLISLDKERGAK